MEQIARTKVAVNGGSFIVRLPKFMCELMGIEKNTVINIYREGNRIILEKDVKKE
jgi:antitoxin component of MazEF toxin-antitoxin module